jgi:hypothetical protein
VCIYSAYVQGHIEKKEKKKWGIESIGGCAAAADVDIFSARL